ncbi:RusA family crossover junction endodeoxyribonuclease [Brevibacillus choshinensis]|uniref:RusA family crossover junction endodeoxyribonuclease n=1 Tax=Brevibacillus choshinensis TaxID=54911 RepID=UPI002E1D0077|nr:RusA family crossover junction endodeoxyribonuclease [Brevibacillus choshinensis]
MKIHIQIEPMGAVRMTRRGKWVNPKAQRYLAYKDEIKSAISLVKGNEDPTAAACGVKIRFIMPIPKSLARKVKPGDVHVKKPDIDNMIKGLFDGANGLIWKDDNQVVDVQAVKVYGETPGIEFEVTELF